MTHMVRKFLLNNFDDLIIRAKNDEFKDEIESKRIALEMLNAGVINRIEMRNKFGLDTKKPTRNMDRFTMQSTQVFIDIADKIPETTTTPKNPQNPPQKAE